MEELGFCQVGVFHNRFILQYINDIDFIGE